MYGSGSLRHTGIMPGPTTASPFYKTGDKSESRNNLNNDDKKPEVTHEDVYSYEGENL